MNERTINAQELKHFPAKLTRCELLGHPTEDLLNTWQNGPHNRWAYQVLSRLIPTAVVWRGDGPASHLNRTPQMLAEMTFAKRDGKEVSVRDWLASTYANGLLVLKGGKIVTELYLNGLQPHMRHHWMSATKSLTGVMAGILVGKGLVDLEDNVAIYVPYLKNTAWDGITVQTALHMQSDVQYREVFDDPSAEVWQHESAAGWRRIGEGNPEDNRSFLCQQRKMTKPDGMFHYRSSETSVVATVLEEASGVGLAELISRELWSKLGAEEDGQILVDRTGKAVGMGGFGATLRDGARFGQMMLQEGFFNGQQIVPVDWVHASRRGDSAKFTHYTELLPKGAYSNQWWIINNDRAHYMAFGYGGQYIYINNEANVVIVKYSTYPEPDYGFAKYDFDAFEGLATVL
jgi:CubicO group peptidase (beta-lactamase class C family)